MMNKYKLKNVRTGDLIGTYEYSEEGIEELYLKIDSLEFKEPSDIFGLMEPIFSCIPPNVRPTTIFYTRAQAEYILDSLGAELDCFENTKLEKQYYERDPLGDF